MTYAEGQKQVAKYRRAIMQRGITRGQLQVAEQHMRLLAKYPRKTMGDTARIMGMHRQNVWRSLRACVEQGLLIRDGRSFRWNVKWLLSMAREAALAIKAHYKALREKRKSESVIAPIALTKTSINKRETGGFLRPIYSENGHKEGCVAGYVPVHLRQHQT